MVLPFSICSRTRNLKLQNTIYNDLLAKINCAVLYCIVIMLLWKIDKKSI